jgi:malate synthase
VTAELFESTLAEETTRLRNALGADVFAAGRFDDAVALFRRLSLAPELEPSFTGVAYQLIS